MRRGAGDEARQIAARQSTAAMHDDFLAQQDARIHAADGDHVNEAMLDAGHHQPDLIHVGGQHDRAARGRGRRHARSDATQQRDGVAHFVDTGLCGEAAEFFQHDDANVRFVTG